MKISEWKQQVSDGKLNGRLEFLYGAARADQQKERYLSVLDHAMAKFGDADVRLFSAPGRTEVGGNHTDHQLGRVLAASIDLDVLAVVRAKEEPVISYFSDAFSVKPVDISSPEVDPEQYNTTESLIAGIAAKFLANHHKIGGFDCYAESDVLPGSGMSSSAAFEILIAEILSVLYNDGSVNPIEQAMIGQYSENVFFGKASGLMDQMACSVGGFVTIDFRDASDPQVRNIPFELDRYGYSLILTDCKQSHADLSEEYSRVPMEMKMAARVMGKNVLSECTMNDLLHYASEIRKTCGDRSFLRAYHFLNETDRVVDEVTALRNGDMEGFLDYVIESGHSSFMYLQNVYPPNDLTHQSLAVGLALSEQILRGKGAWRVHGGGFAGTIQAFVPLDLANIYVKTMESVFGSGSCYTLRIRSVGGYEIRPDEN
ncbi:MAG: galactokinase [Solobacterium sp.]|nr:galactokinase [Solobacterium sp.]